MLRENIGTAQDGSVGVHADKNSHVLEGVLALSEGALGEALVGGAEDGLDFLRVDETGEVGHHHHRGGESVVLFEFGALGVGSVKSIELLKGGLSPDAEAAKMATRGELEQVKGINAAQLNTGDVAEGFDNSIVLVVNDKGSTSLGEAAVAHLTLACTDLLGVLDLFNVTVGVKGLEESDGLSSLCEVLDAVGNDEGNFVDLLYAMATGHNESGDTRGSNSGS